MYIKKILVAVALIGLLVAAFFAYYVYSAMFVPNTSFNNSEAHIYVPSNANYDEVRTLLVPLLKDIDKFDAVAKRKKYTTNIRGGKFVIKKDMTNNDIINSIRSNNIPVRVSFNNQNSLALLAGRIATQIEADSLSLITSFKDAGFQEANGFNEATALGMYVPNSYEFFWNTSADEFKSRMLKEYNRFWNDSRKQKAKAAGLRPDEVIALASIVQEESKQKNEQPRIAGVYMNRLKNNWTLDADPTLKFAAYKLPKYKNTIIKRVLNEHKRIESPYNTYKNQGLPPGLIVMPDITAIDAVLNYETHDYFFFVVDAERPGYHKFSKTIQQHNRYAREYHRYLNNRGIRR